MNTRRRLTGFVISNKMDKTVIVEVTRTYRHNLYKKVVHSKNKFMAHDVIGCQVGDQVRIVESRPISRHKRWVVEEVLRAVQRGDVRDIDELEVSEPETAEVEAGDPGAEEAV